MEQPKRGRKPKPKAEVIEFPDRDFRPAFDPEGREKQLMKLAYDAAERQLRDGTASAAVITHFLKLGTKKEVLEREILEKQKVLIEAKSNNLQQGKDAGELAKGALDAIAKYRSSSTG